MNSFFEKDDFKLCTAPVPIGYLQSQTHAGIGLYKGHYILTTSPYPHPKFSKFNIYCKAILKKITNGRVNLLQRGEDFENPCVYISSEENEIPTNFRLLKGSPLMNKPFNYYGLRSYCSDPDLYIEGENIYVLNRATCENPDASYSTKIYLIEAFLNNTDIEVKKIDLLFVEGDISPCITKYRGRYIYMALDTNSYNDGTPCKELFLREGKTLRNFSDRKRLSLVNGEYEPWHMSLFQHNNRLYAIVACIKKGKKGRCYQMLGVFNDDLSELKIIQTPLTDYNSYRGSAIVNKNNEFVLYSTTVGERFKDDNSIDGRSVIMAHTPFTNILKLIDNDEQ